jgi:hypothetical protein
MVSSKRWDSLAGLRSHEIAEKLGRPDEIGTLVHRGITWTRITYVCRGAPARATDEEKIALRKGWKFAPGLLLRDGVVVPLDTFDREVIGDRRTAVPPPELQFQRGGLFP